MNQSFKLRACHVLGACEERYISRTLRTVRPSVEWLLNEGIVCRPRDS